MAVCYLILYIWVSTFIEINGQTTVGQVNTIVCLSRTTEQLASTGDQLTIAFTTSQLVHLVLLFDMSGRISATNLASMKTFAEDLVTFLQIQFGLYLNPANIRLEIIVFNAVVNLTGFDVNSCEFSDLLDRIQQPNVDYRSYVSAAMNLALIVFRAATVARGTSALDASQILFVITDGDFDDAPGEIALAVYRLRVQGVRLFACSVGLLVEQKVMSLTTNSSTGYLCFDDWEYVLSPAVQGSPSRVLLSWKLIKTKV